MVTNRNHRLKRHRLEHPLLIGQGVVIGHRYSDGIGKSRWDRNAGLQTEQKVQPQTAIPDNELGKEPGIGVQVEPKASRRRNKYELGNHI